MSKSNFVNSLKLKNKEYKFFDLNLAAERVGLDLKKLPYSIRVLIENAIRNGEGDNFVAQFKNWGSNNFNPSSEFNFMPARVLMQDFTGVPAVVDLAAMRDAIVKIGGDPSKVNPLIPVDLVIDHSVQVDEYGSKDSLDKNTKLEFERNLERYKFLKWGQSAFKNFKVVPPGTGICHQVNLEYIAQVVWQRDENGETLIYPDSLVGTDSHTTMVNGLGVLGWGVGGIEAEAAMLGQPLPMLIPEVIGVEFSGNLKEGVTATDLVLTVTEALRKRGVVGKFVEYFGKGLESLPLADRATIANMAPEYGATCGFFPVDHETVEYLNLTGRSEETLELVSQYCKHQKLWHDPSSNPVYTDVLKIDLASIEPSLAGPKRPQDRVTLGAVKKSIENEIVAFEADSSKHSVKHDTGEGFGVAHGDVVIAAITSCTNTSNPYVLVAAGLVAKKASDLGVNIKPWVKASLAPGSQVVTEYLSATGLLKYLEELRFNVVGYGCTTCIGNSGPLKSSIEQTITNNKLVVSSVLSGNRNFEGRVHPLVRANYLASPPLVVAYAIAGTTKIDISTDPIAKDKNGKDVFLKDIWPSNKEVSDMVHGSLNREMFMSKYKSVFDGDDHWKNINVKTSSNYSWDDSSTYIKNPPYFDKFSGGENHSLKGISAAKIIAIFGDSVTTDHISPAGNISKTSPAAKYLSSLGVEQKDFNSYGARRGNHEIMMRGTFANIRIKNKLLDGVEGGFTKHFPSGEQMSIYDAAMKYVADSVPLVVFAGKEYGTGSSRDWAAKGTSLLGIKAVIAESFERIHRSNLVGMGVLPLTFTGGMNVSSLSLKGDEEINILGIDDNFKPMQKLTCQVVRGEKVIASFEVQSMVMTENEIDCIKNGSILHQVVKQLHAAK